MPRNRATRLTKFELEVMNALWPLGRASIREVQEQLPEHRRPVYTTVQTIFRRLEEKGAVRRVRRIGGAFIYEPLMTQTAMRGRIVDDVLDLFDGSVRTLMAHLVETERLSLEDLRALEKAAGEIEKRERGDS